MKQARISQKSKGSDTSSKINKYDKRIWTKIISACKWSESIPDKVRESIKDQIKSVYKRCGYKLAWSIAKILDKYQDRIGKRKFDIGCIDGIEYKIRLKDGVKPRRCQPLQLPADHEAEIERTVIALLEAGLIERYEGPWAVSNAFVVYNNDMTTRMVMNYKWINNRTTTDSYPVPSVKDTLSRFQGKTVYSTFDIIKAFNNVKVAEDSKKYTAFTTKYGTFVWNVMPFGGTNSPAVWARASDECFRECRDMIKYVDDIIIASNRDETGSENENHLRAIESFFTCLARYNLKIKLSKCQFFVKKVKFLGNIITPEGRSVDDEYIKRLLSFRHPESKTELRAYLGAIEWISRHVFGMKELTDPLRELLKHKDEYKWDPIKHQKAFQRIQTVIQRCEVLAHPDWKDPFYIFVDSSDRFYGAILLQKRFGKYVIIDMFSRVWNHNDRVKHITHKELYALVLSIKEWNQYLIHSQFTVHSDARNLSYLFKQTNIGKTKNKQHYRWALLLQQYRFTVQHISGIHNKLADYLSRYVDHEQIKEYKEGSISFAKYNEHKRMKMMPWNRWKNKKLCMKRNEFMMHQLKQHEFNEQIKKIEAETPSDWLYFQKCYNAHLRDSGSKYRQNGGYHDQYQEAMPYRIECGGWTDYLIANAKLKDHLFPEQRRRSSRLASKPRIDLKEKERIFHNPVTVIPEEWYSSNHTSARQNEASQHNELENDGDSENEINSGTQTQEMMRSLISDEDIADRIKTRSLDQNELDILESAQSGDTTKRSNETEMTLDSDPTSDHEILDPTMNWDVPDRIYKDELLKDPMIKKLERFDIDKIIQNQQENVVYNVIIKYLKGEDTENEIDDLPKGLKRDVTNNKYILKGSNGNILCYVNDHKSHRICLPPEHRKALLDYYHKNLMYGGHKNANAIIKKIQNRWYWRGYDQEIRDYVNTCLCQKVHRVPRKNMGKLQLFRASQPNEMVAIDHKGPLPASRDRNRYITTYYDRFTGFAMSVPVRRIDAFTTAITFYHRWICLFGAPDWILSDNGSDFVSVIFEYLCKWTAMKHKYAAIYHPQCNGAVERFNTTIQSQLRAISIDKRLDFSKGDSWDIYVPIICSTHNNRLSRRFNYKYCPNDIFLGRRLRSPIDWKLGDEIFRDKPGIKWEGFVNNCIRMNSNRAAMELSKYDDARRRAANRKLKEVKYKKDDLILIWNGGYPTSGKKKLAPTQWEGPFRILNLWNHGNNMNVQSVEFPEVLDTANVKRVTLWKPPKEFKGKTLEEKAVIANKQKRLRKQQRLRQDQDHNVQRDAFPQRLYKADDGKLRHCVLMGDANADGIRVQFVRCGDRKTVNVDRLIPFDEELKDTAYQQTADEKHSEEEKQAELEQEQEEKEQL